MINDIQLLQQRNPIPGPGMELYLEGNVFTNDSLYLYWLLILYCLDVEFWHLI